MLTEFCAVRFGSTHIEATVSAHCIAVLSGWVSEWVSEVQWPTRHTLTKVKNTQLSMYNSRNPDKKVCKSKKLASISSNTLLCATDSATISRNCCDPDLIDGTVFQILSHLLFVWKISILYYWLYSSTVSRYHDSAWQFICHNCSVENQIIVLYTTAAQ